MPISGLEVQTVLKELKRILAEDMDVNLSLGEIADDVSLLDDGLALDSILLVELITHIESRLSLEFDDTDLRVKSFSRLDILADLVARKVHAA